MDISMPLEVNIACLGITKELESRRLSFLSGWLAFFMFSLLTCILLNVHRLQPNKSNSDPRVYENIQKIASILCSSAVLYIARVFLDFEEIGTNLPTMESEIDQAVTDETDNLDTYTNMKFTSDMYVFDLGMCLGSIVVVIAFFFYFIGFATRKHHKMLRKELLSSSESTSGGNEDAWHDVNNLVPFYATFCLQYTPESKNHEQVAYQRRVSLMLLTNLAGVILKSVLYLMSLSKGSDVSFFSQAWDAANYARVPLIITGELCFFVILVQTEYLEALQKRPFLSPRESSVYGDVVNDTEKFVTRSFVWASFSTVVRMLSTEVFGKENEVVAGILTNSICIVLLLALLWGHRRLYMNIWVLTGTNSEDNPDSNSERGGRGRANSAFSGEEASNRTVVKMMSSKNEKELLEHYKDLIPLIPSMSPQEQRRWLPLIRQEEEEEEEEEDGPSWKVLLEVLVLLIKTFVVIVIFFVIVVICIAGGYFGQEIQGVLVGVFLLDCLAFARFERRFRRSENPIDRPAAEEEGTRTDGEGGEGEDDDIEMSTISESEMGNRPGTFRIENPMRRDKVAEDNNNDDDEEMGEMETVEKEEQPPTTSQRNKALVKNPSARAGPGVQNLKKNYEMANVNEEGEEQGGAEVGQVVLHEGVKEATL